MWRFWQVKNLIILEQNWRELIFLGGLEKNMEVITDHSQMTV